MSRKIKVMHLLASSSIGGAESVVFWIFDVLGKKYNMHFVCLPGPVEFELKSRGISYSTINKLNAKSIRNIVKKIKPDVIHAHDYRASVAASLFTNKLKIVSHLHSTRPQLRKRGIWTILYEIASYRMQNIIYVSPAMKEEFKISKTLRKKTIILPNVINANRIIEIAGTGIDSEGCDILFLGRLNPEKNPLRFIEVVNRLVENGFENIKAWMIGEGPLREECIKKINEYKLQNNIQLLGYISQPYKYLYSAKMLMMTSEYEGRPMAAIEALCLGVPIILPRIGIRDSLIHNDCGGFICNSIEEYVENASKLLSDKEYWIKQSKYAREAFNQSNNEGKYCETLKKLYDK